MRPLAVAVALLGGCASGVSDRTAEAPRAVVAAASSTVPMTTSAAPSASAGSSASRDTPPALSVAQQILAAGDSAPSTDNVEIVTKPFGDSQVVVLAKGKDGRVAGLGLYSQGPGPLTARLLARSGPLTIADDDEVADLDLAKFRVTADETAIGLRFQRTRGYAGGGGQASVLRLFVRRGNVLAPVFSAVLDFSCMLAGEWNPDGTRQHVEVDGHSILAVSPDETRGHFDLVQRTPKRNIAVFQWDGDRYAPAKQAARTGDDWGEIHRRARDPGRHEICARRVLLAEHGHDEHRIRDAYRRDRGWDLSHSHTLQGRAGRFLLLPIPRRRR
jgi:hypothetical protein